MIKLLKRDKGFSVCSSLCANDEAITLYYTASHDIGSSISTSAIAHVTRDDSLRNSSSNRMTRLMVLLLLIAKVKPSLVVGLAVG